MIKNIPSVEGYAPRTGPYTAKQWLGIAIHHMIAHPFTFFTGDARWSWRLHDWSYRTATGDTTPSPARVHTCPHLSVRQRIAAFLHDVVAHPLIFVAGGARWAWAIHDRSGEALMAFDQVPSSLRIGGERAEDAAALLREHGFVVESCDADGDPTVLVHGFGSGPAAEVLSAHGIPITLSRHRAATPPHGEPAPAAETNLPEIPDGSPPAPYQPREGEWVVPWREFAETESGVDWWPEMAACLGQPGRVVGVDRDGDVYVCHDNAQWWWPADALRPKVRPTTDEPGEVE